VDSLAGSSIDVTRSMQAVGRLGSQKVTVLMPSVRGSKAQYFLIRRLIVTPGPSQISERLSPVCKTLFAVSCGPRTGYNTDKAIRDMTLLFGARSA
jgi:hypothetical protein